MIRKTLKYAIRTLAVVLVLLIGNSGMLFLWLVNEPREIPFIKGRIEHEFNKFTATYPVTVGKTLLQWDGAEEGFGIHLVGLSIKDETGEAIGQLPDIKVKLDFFNLLIGKVQLKDMRLMSPHITLSRSLLMSAEKDFIGPLPLQVGPDLPSEYRQLMMDILQAIERNGSESPIKNITIADATLEMKHWGRSIIWQVPEFRIEFLPTGSIVNFKGSGSLSRYGDEAAISLEGMLDDGLALEVNYQVVNLTPRLIAEALPEIGWFSTLDVALQASGQLKLSPEGNPEWLTFKAGKQEGGETLLHTTRLQASGKISFYEEGLKLPAPHIQMQAELKDLPAHALPHIWPPQYASNPREWLLPSVISGLYEKAKVKIDILPEEILTGNLRKKAIQAELAFRDVEIIYFEKFPPLRYGHGTAVFNSHGVKINVDHAEFNSSRITGAELTIHDMLHDSVYMEIEGDIEGSAQDLFGFQIVSADSPSGQMKPSAGTAKTHFYVSFPLIKTLQLEQINYTITSQLQGLAMQNVMPDINLEEGAMQLTMQGNHLMVSGAAKIASLPLQLTYEEYYGADAPYRQRYAINSILTPQEITLNGLNDALSPYLEGAMDIRLELVEHQDKQEFSGMVGLNEAKITVKEIGYTKASGTPVSVAFSGILKGGDVEVTTLKAEGQQLLVEGNGSFNKENKTLNIKSDKAVISDNNLSFSYQQQLATQAHKLQLKGAKLNAAPLIESFLNAEEKDTKRSTALDIALEVDTVTLAHGVQLSNLKGNWLCNPQFCEKGNISGTFSDNSALKITYTPQPALGKDTRQLAVYSGNAGDFIRGIGLLEQVNAGNLHASAISDSRGKGLYEGKLIMKDFKVVKAPLLGKLLTIASFTGIVDLLNGHGISFKKLDSSFSYDDKGQISISGMKAAGNSIGMTLDGLIDTRQSILNLDGAVIPAYSVNNLLGDIPVVGNILIGKKGEGIIATRYSVEGAFNDPSISVNPFSMLTPGFLRNIWGGEDMRDAIEVPAVEAKKPNE